MVTYSVDINVCSNSVTSKADDGIRGVLTTAQSPALLCSEVVFGIASDVDVVMTPG